MESLMGIIEMIIALIPIITQVLQLVSKLLEPLTELIKIWIDYTKLRKQRIEESIKEEIDAKKKAKEEEYYKAMANVQAFRIIEVQAWQDRYDIILNYLNAKEYHKVLALLHVADSEQVNQFLFNSDLDVEYKALKIINIMKEVPSEV